MYKGIVQSGTPITANTNIRFDTVISNDRVIKYNSSKDVIKFLKTGDYEVHVSLHVTGIAQSRVSLQLYNGDTPIASAVDIQDIAVSTNAKTLNVYDVLRVRNSDIGDVAELSVRLIGSDAITVSISSIIIREVA